MDIVQSFYDHLAPEYDKLFQDWHSATREQGALLERLLREQGFDTAARILDCACGIGTQAIGLAQLGYSVAASDISDGALAQAKARAAAANLKIRFEKADFRDLFQVFSDPFDVILAMDNALPHMLSGEDLARAVQSIAARLGENGIFIGSIRDYDALLREKPPYSAPYIHKTAGGQRVSFQTWDWHGDRYALTQYIIEDGEKTEVSRFECEYRATCREELTRLFLSWGCRRVSWHFPVSTGFYQPILIARK